MSTPPRLMLALLAALAFLWLAGRRGPLPLGAVADEAVEFYEGAVSAVSGWALPSRAEPYRAAIEAAEARYDMPSGMWARQLYEESRFRPEIIDGRLSSVTGAQGIAQFMPATAAELGVNPLDAFAAIEAGARYMRRLRDSLGDWKLALAAYNWGIGNVRRRGIDRAPAETRRYVADIAGDVGLA